MTLNNISSILFILILFFYSFPINTKANECKKFANEYKIKIIAAPTSPLNTDPTEYNLKFSNKINQEEYIYSLKNLKSNEIISLMVSKMCNDLLFNLPFSFTDHKGVTGFIDANYLLNYQCNSLIRNAKGEFIGNCKYVNDHLGNIQIQDTLDIYGNPAKRKNF